MKKFLIVVLLIIGVCIALASIGPIIGLAISLAVAYFSFKQYMKSMETGSKIFWGIVGIIAIISAITNAPAIIGLIVIYGIYVGYKHLNESKTVTTKSNDDPFDNFEKEWEEFNKNFK